MKSTVIQVSIIVAKCDISYVSVKSVEAKGTSLPNRQMCVTKNSINLIKLKLAVGEFPTMKFHLGAMGLVTLLGKYGVHKGVASTRFSEIDITSK